VIDRFTVRGGYSKRSRWRPDRPGPVSGRSHPCGAERTDACRFRKTGNRQDRLAGEHAQGHGANRHRSLTDRAGSPHGARRPTDDRIIGPAWPRSRPRQPDRDLGRLSGSTLHKLLVYSSRTGGFLYGPGRPIPADVIAVDEVSMVDVVMMDRFSRPSILIVPG
jgi:hypothetical protein